MNRRTGQLDLPSLLYASTTGNPQ